jgi:hypothetical protein
MVNKNLSETREVFMTLLISFQGYYYCMPTVAANNRQQDGSFMLYIHLTAPLAQATRYCTVYIHTWIPNLVKVTT